MTYDHFINQVQHRARLSSHGDAVGAVRATLETLAERLGGGEVKDLASQLPREIAYYLLGGFPELSERFGFQEFVWRVSQREYVDPQKAAFHARVVMELVGEAVSRGEMEDVFQQLPPEFAPLFAGSTGRSPNRRKTIHPDEGYRAQQGGGDYDQQGYRGEQGERRGGQQGYVQQGGQSGYREQGYGPQGGRDWEEGRGEGQRRERQGEDWGQGGGYSEQGYGGQGQERRRGEESRRGQEDYGHQGSWVGEQGYGQGGPQGYTSEGYGQREFRGQQPGRDFGREERGEFRGETRGYEDQGGENRERGRGMGRGEHQTRTRSQRHYQE